MTADAAGASTALDATLRSLHLAHNGRLQQQLLSYVDVLSKWNAVHNLTAIRARDDILTHHVADCLAVVQPIMRWLQAHTASAGRVRLLDVGSGGGLPGLVIATMLPAIDVTCVDSVGKKVAFIQQAALSMELTNVSVLHERVEAMQIPRVDLIVSRAFSSLDRFVDLTRHLLQPGGAWLAMKGKPPTDELSALADKSTETFHVEHLLVPGLAADRCLVWIEPR